MYIGKIATFINLTSASIGAMHSVQLCIAIMLQGWFQLPSPQNFRGNIIETDLTALKEYITALHCIVHTKILFAVTCVNSGIEIPLSRQCKIIKYKNSLTTFNRSARFRFPVQDLSYAICDGLNWKDWN